MVVPFCLKNRDNIMILSDAIEDVKMHGIAFWLSKVGPAVIGDISKGILIHIECLNEHKFDVVLK